MNLLGNKRVGVGIKRILNDLNSKSKTSQEFTGFEFVTAYTHHSSIIAYLTATQDIMTM